MRVRHATVALPLLAALAGPALAEGPPMRFAMMDMMPMGGSPAAPGGPAPMQSPGGGMPMGNDAGRMGSPMPMPPSQTQPGGGAMPMPDVAAQPGVGGASTMGANAMCAMMQAMMQAMARTGGMAMPAPQPAPVPGGDAMQGSSAARLEGRIAFLRAELRITDTQGRAWDTFAAALRSSRDHLDQARDVLQSAGNAADPMSRLQAYEAHLAARAEAVRSSRLAFDALFAQLDDSQKRAATTLMLPFIGAF